MCRFGTNNAFYNQCYVIESKLIIIVHLILYFVYYSVALVLGCAVHVRHTVQ